MHRHASPKAIAFHDGDSLLDIDFNTDKSRKRTVSCFFF